MKFNEILRNLRKSTGKQIKEVAKEVGIPADTISKYELGRHEPDIANIIILANYYHVSIDYLLKNKEKETYEITKEEFIEFTNFKKEFDKMYKMLGLIESKNTIRNLKN